MGRRIGIVSAYFPPHMGGVEQFSSHLADELMSHDYSVSVITDNDGGHEAYEMLPSGVEVFRFPCKNLAGGRFPLLEMGHEPAVLRDVVLRDEFVGFLINTRFYPLSLFGIRLARDKGLRPVVLDHGSSYLGFGDKRVDWAVRGYERAMTWVAKRHHPDFYGISAKSVAWLGELGIQAKGVIHNAIDAQEFRSESTSRDFRGELGIRADEMLAVFTGRLVANKGIFSVSEVCRRLEAEGSPIHMVVAGDGPCKTELMESAVSHMHVVGRLERGDVSALLQQSDLFLFPSEYPEGMPTSILEASAAGLTTIGTDVGGVRELLPDESYGIVYEQFDADKCVEQLRWYDAHRDVLHERGKRCKELVETEFSWEQTARMVLKAIEAAQG